MIVVSLLIVILTRLVVWFVLLSFFGDRSSWSSLDIDINYLSFEYPLEFKFLNAEAAESLNIGV